MKTYNTFLKLSIATLAGVLWSVASFAHAGLPQTQRLKTSLTRTDAETTRLLGRLATFQKGLNAANLALKIPSKVSWTLSKIDDSLKTTVIVITPLQVIPKVGPVIGKVARVMKILQRKVHPIRLKAEKLSHRLRKVQKGVYRTQRVATYTSRLLKTIRISARISKRAVATTERCINNTSNPRLRHAMRYKLEIYSRRKRPQVDHLNRILGGINYGLDRTEEELKKARNAANFFKPIEVPLNKMRPVLAKLDVAFGEIRKVLNKKIHIKYPVKVRKPFQVRVRTKVKVRVRVRVKFRVKVKKWYKPWSWKWTYKTKFRWKWKTKWQWKWTWKTRWKLVVQTKRFSFTVGQILKGIDTGVSLVNRKLMAYAKRAINPLLKKLGIKIPGIPGLHRLLGKIRTLNNLALRLPRRLSLVSANLGRINSNIKRINLRSFPLICR